MVDQELLQALRTVIKEEVAPLNTRMGSLEIRMDSLDARMDSLDARIDGLDARMDSLGTRMDGLDARVEKLERAVLKVQATQEIKVLPTLSLLAEGHENIVEHIQEKIDARADKLQDSIDALNIVVKYHSQDIQELKKAQ